MSNEKQIKEERSMVNDWACAQQLEIFKQRYLDPMEVRYEKAQKILDNKAHRWESLEQKQKAKDKFDEMDGYLSLYRALYGATMDLIHQHEALVNTMANGYSSWYNVASKKGKQMTEMMSMQANEIERIFQTFYDALGPLKLPLQPTKYKQDEN